MALIGTSEAAKQLGVSIRRVRALIESGKLKAEKIGRDWLMDASAVKKLSDQPRPRGRPKKASEGLKRQ